MEFGAMIKELLTLSKVKQSDLSQALGYSASEMSKYITGTRIPPARGMRLLVERCAAVFANALWEQGQAKSLRALFPLLHDIKSRQELEYFLRQAISLSYRVSRMKSEEGQDSIMSTSLVLMGWDAVYHHLLTMLSIEILQQSRDLHIYFTLDLFLAFIRSSPLPRMARGDHAIKVHVLFNPRTTDDHLTLRDLQLFLSHLEDAGSVVQFEAWVAQDTVTPQSFCFLEGGFALLLNGLVQGSLLGIHMEEPQYLMELGWLMRQLYTNRASHSHGEALAALSRDSKGMLKALKTCKGIYAFGNFGFLAQRHHLEHLDADDKLKDLLAEALGTLVRLPIPMMINAAGVNHFTENPSTRVPLLGELRFDRQEQVAYLAAYEDIAQEGKGVSVYLTKSEFPQCAILVLKDSLLVYLPGQDVQQEQFISLPRVLCDRLLPGLEVILRKESIPLDSALLSTYLGTLAAAGNHGG